MAPKRQKKEAHQEAHQETLETVVPAEQTLGASHVRMYNGGQGILLGFRVPKDYFLCVGQGDTDEGSGVDGWETGSYDLALEEGHIEDFNIVAYTSVIPAEATEVKYEDVKHTFHHGAVLETIMAKMDGSKGDRISAGVGMMKVRRKADGHVIGGWAAEYKGHAHEANVKEILKQDMDGMFARRFPKDDHEMFDIKYITKEMEVQKTFGTVLAAICFCSFLYPIATPALPADRA